MLRRSRRAPAGWRNLSLSAVLLRLRRPSEPGPLCAQAPVQVIFVGGEPGAGKSRLAEELSAAMHRQGAGVLMGICTPEPAPPYQPFAECLDQLLGGTPEGALAECMPDSAQRVAAAHSAGPAAPSRFAAAA